MVAPDTAGVEQLREQTPPHCHRARLGSQRGTRLGHWDVLGHLTEATHQLQVSVRPQTKGSTKKDSAEPRLRILPIGD